MGFVVLGFSSGDKTLITWFRICSMAMTSFCVVDGQVVVVEEIPCDRLNTLRSVARNNPDRLIALLRNLYPGLTSYRIPGGLLAEELQAA